MNTLENSIKEQIENMSSSDLMELNNAYCDAASYNDDRIYDNDDSFLEENFSSISEAVRAATYGEYSFSHSYVKFDGNANLESLNSIDIDDLVDGIDTIIDYAIENQNYFPMLDFDFEEEEEETED